MLRRPDAEAKGDWLLRRGVGVLARQARSIAAKVPVPLGRGFPRVRPEKGDRHLLRESRGAVRRDRTAAEKEPVPFLLAVPVPLQAVVGRWGQVVFATLVLGYALVADRPASADPARDAPALVTRHYRVYSDLPERLSALATPQDPRLVHDVRLYADQADFRLANGTVAGMNTGGLYDSRRRLLTAFVGDGGRAGLKRTLRHEAFHQWAYESIGPGLPVWINEGLAQVFEHGVRVDDTIVLGELPEVKLKIVREAIARGELFDFARILRMDGREWFRQMDDREAGRLLYAQCWLMVHFLVYAEGTDGRPLYRGRFNDLLRDVASGQPARFEQWAVALRPSVVSLEIDRHDILARMLIDLAGRGQEFRRLDDFRETVSRFQLRLHREEDGIRRVSSPDPVIYFQDHRGRPMGRDRMRFEPDPLGELPRLVTRPGDGRVYRTSFYRWNGQLFHETTVSHR